MKVLLIGLGTVGEAIARLSAGKPWLEQMVLADHDLDRARRSPPRSVTATSHPDCAHRCVRHRCGRGARPPVRRRPRDERRRPTLRDARVRGCARCWRRITWTRRSACPSLTRPTRTASRVACWATSSSRWTPLGATADRLALLGMGISPGLVQVFAAHAAKHLFDEIHDINIRAGGDLRIEGVPFATVFSIWTTIEECLNPSLVWEKERGFFTLPPFSEPERFIFPEGVGPVECVHVEHEDVVMIPRVLDARRVTFKYALGEEFIGALMVLHAIGLDRTDAIEVDGQQVIPRNVVAALVPEPAELGDNMTGRAIVGVHVTGLKDGEPREVFSYQMCDAQEIMSRYGLQPVGFQAGFNPVVAMELIADRPLERQRRHVGRVVRPRPATSPSSTATASITPRSTSRRVVHSPEPLESTR